jgi:hypothetical protein
MRIFIKAPLTCIGGIIMAFSLSPQLSLILSCSVLAGGTFIYLHPVWASQVLYGAESG